MKIFFFISLLLPFFLGTPSATILVDGVSQWENPTVHVGDSIIFKYHHIKASPAQPPGKPITTSPSPELSQAEAPAPTSGGPILSSAPVYPCPFRPRQAAVSPAPSATSSSPVSVPSLVPDNKGGGIPFINSNPAVPLPTGEVDSATIQPLPISDHRGQVTTVIAGTLIPLVNQILDAWHLQVNTGRRTDSSQHQRPRQFP